MKEMEGELIVEHETEKAMLVYHPEEHYRLWAAKKFLYWYEDRSADWEDWESEKRFIEEGDDDEWKLREDLPQTPLDWIIEGGVFDFWGWDDSPDSGNAERLEGWISMCSHMCFYYEYYAKPDEVIWDGFVKWGMHPVEKAMVFSYQKKKDLWGYERDECPQGEETHRLRIFPRHWDAFYDALVKALPDEKMREDLKLDKRAVRMDRYLPFTREEGRYDYVSRISDEDKENAISVVVKAE